VAASTDQLSGDSKARSSIRQSVQWVSNSLLLPLLWRMFSTKKIHY
jgi:hypothetical protein